jgi:hypothetical protein
MCATDQVHVVFLQEPGDNIGPEGEGDPTVVLTPTCEMALACMMMTKK